MVIRQLLQASKSHSRQEKEERELPPGALLI
jgi:hypothetical protein